MTSQERKILDQLIVKYDRLAQTAFEGRDRNVAWQKAEALKELRTDILRYHAHVETRR